VTFATRLQAMTARFGLFPRQGGRAGHFRR
jgi:hypothetical protein